MSRDELGTGPVPNPSRIGGTEFFPSTKRGYRYRTERDSDTGSGTGTRKSGFSRFFREFPDLVPVPYRIGGTEFFPSTKRGYRYRTERDSDTGSGTVPVSVSGFGSKCSSLGKT